MAVDKATVAGLKEAQAVFRALPDTAREAYIDVAVWPTLSEVARVGRSRLVPGHGVRTGALREALGFSVNRRSGWGKVGIRTGFERFLPGRSGSASTSAGARAIRPTRYGHLYHFRHDPFLVRAAEGEQAAFLARAKQAGKSLEVRMADLAHRGGGLL